MQQKLMSMTLTSSIHWLGNGAGITMAKSGLTNIRDVSPGGVPKYKYKFWYLWVFWSNISGPEIPAVASGIKSRKFMFRRFSGKTMVAVNNNGKER